MRESELPLGLASTVASPTVAIDRESMGTDRIVGRNEAARSRDVGERRAAIVGINLFGFHYILNLSLSLSLSLTNKRGK